MSKEIFYKQCKLQNQASTQVCYIPEKFAKLNMSVNFNNTAVWWQVMEVYESSRTEYSLIRDVSHNAGDIWKATSGPEPRGNK